MALAAIVALRALILGTIIGVAIELLSLILLLIALPPIPQLRAFAQSAQRSLVSSLGDSYAFVISPIQFSAMTEQVIRDLRWLSNQCDDVAVVAHSQGAAVAHAAVRRYEGRVSRLITFGSGLGRLRGLQAALSSRSFVLGGWLALGGAVASALLHGSFTCFVTSCEQTSAWDLPAMLVAWTAWAALGTGLVMALDGARAPVGELRIPGVRPHAWTDLYASDDPVSVGPIARPHEVRSTGVRSREVYNRASFIADHGRYWDNTDQFVSEVVSALARASGLDVGMSRTELRHIGERRRWRVGWLGFSRRAATFAVLAILILQRDFLIDLGEPVLTGLLHVGNAIPIVGLLIPDADEWIASAGDVAPLATGALMVILGGWVWHSVSAVVWGWWDGREITASLDGPPRDYGNGGWPFTLLALLSGMALCVAAFAWNLPVLVAGADGILSTLLREELLLAMVFTVACVAYAQILLATMPGLAEYMASRDDTPAPTLTEMIEALQTQASDKPVELPPPPPDPTPPPATDQATNLSSPLSMTRASRWAFASVIAVVLVALTGFQRDEGLGIEPWQIVLGAAAAGVVFAEIWARIESRLGQTPTRIANRVSQALWAPWPRWTVMPLRRRLGPAAWLLGLLVMAAGLGIVFVLPQDTDNGWVIFLSFVPWIVVPYALYLIIGLAITSPVGRWVADQVRARRHAA